MHSYSSEDKRQSKHPDLVEFHSSAGRCIIKKGINKQFKYLWKCYEGHKIGYWIESNWGWRETTFVWMVNRRALWEVNIRDKTYMRKSRPSENLNLECPRQKNGKRKAPEQKWSRCVQRTARKLLVGFSGWSSKGKGESSKRQGWWGGQKANDSGSKGLGKECSIH